MIQSVDAETGLIPVLKTLWEIVRSKVRKNIRKPER
jgi:hypothetical protein